MSAARTTTMVDDERMRVTTLTFDAVGDATGWHVHEYDYVIVPVSRAAASEPSLDGQRFTTRKPSSVFAPAWRIKP